MSLWVLCPIKYTKPDDKLLTKSLLFPLWGFVFIGYCHNSLSSLWPNYFGKQSSINCINSSILGLPVSRTYPDMAKTQPLTLSQIIAI